MIKYRVKQVGHSFFPQKLGLLFWNYFYIEDEHSATYPCNYNTLEEAKRFLDMQPSSSRIIYHPYP